MCSYYMIVTNLEMAPNPFYFKELPVDAPFCDREKELADLASFAKARANAVLYSPRRFGKTSLVKRVQKRLADEGAVTLYADFFGATSVEDVASRLAKAVFSVPRDRKSLWEAALRTVKSFRPVLRPDEKSGVSLSVELSSQGKGGMDLLDETMASLGEFVEASKSLVQVSLDEFQEIVDLKDALKIEGILRSHVQRHRCSYFFVGSRRRILLGIFNDRQRPFFQSAVNYELKPLPGDELARFVADRFRKSGKACSPALAESMAAAVQGHPYYTQKLAFFVFESAGEKVEEEDVASGFDALIAAEHPVFEAIVQGLAPKQVALLKALSKERSSSLFSMDYMRRHNLGSVGGVQGAVKRLSELDLIERDDRRRWSVVDPLFELWLRGESTFRRVTETATETPT